MTVVSASITLWSGLELRHLLALQAVHEHGSFHRAAAHLDYTQSGISQQIRALEGIVGERLLERPGGSRPVRLTASGEVVLRHARAVFSQVTAAQADLVALSAGSSGTLRVGAFQSVGAVILPPLMRRLALAHPALRVELTQTTSDDELYKRLAEAELDVGFTMLPAPPGPFAACEIFEDPFVAVAAHGSELLASRRRLSFTDLAALPLVTAQTCRSIGDLTVQARERGIEPNVVYRTDDNGTLLGLVAGGDVVGLAPKLVARTANGSVQTVALDELIPPRRVALTWRADGARSAAREVFVAEVERACATVGLRTDPAAARHRGDDDALSP